ncbi:uncharacterized protein LOC128220446 [Mya arenaria]|uniref:uncharacterized protein LOC128220446 n=1 Tax=Mya arenaria TaxID=6604 RepID=UPI0022E5E678|nr:uncharacterized protein LOC128220446 [Mya arenaria]
MHMDKVSLQASCILVVLIWNSVLANTTEGVEIEQTHVRTWSRWYNTDKPTSDEVEDERVISIRKRGYQICDGNAPIDVLCRAKNSPHLLFNQESAHLAPDILYVQCTTKGLLCRTADQRDSRKCLDYQIRFECLSVLEPMLPPNIGVIGVAAGLSVIVPILCVAIMHVVRICRGRGIQSQQSAATENAEQSVQSDYSTLPPSYSFLFGSDPDLRVSDVNGYDVPSGGNSEANLEQGHVNDGSVSVNLIAPPPVDGSQDRLSSGSLPDLGEYRNSVQGDRTSQGPAQPRSPTWRARFPNMHLSLFELFRWPSIQEPTSPQSPDLSYVQTPPPTYKDAVDLLALDKKPPSSTDTTIDLENTQEKVEHPS